jgi:DNA-binding MarR family transcriptional regulator
MEQETQELDTTILWQLAATCACTHVRKAARVITQLYDTLLEPSGLRITQFIVLVTIALFEQDTVMQLAEKLAMDRSALAHTLRSLEEQGLVTVAPGRDRRTRVVRLTTQGRQAVLQTLPHWRAAQEQMLARFGEPQLRSLLAVLKPLESLNPALAWRT